MWTWDGTTWTQQTPAVVPPPREGGVLVSLGSTVVLFGGLGPGETMMNDTWTWNGSTWTQQVVANPPPARAWAVAATLGDQVVLFRGQSLEDSFDDTWTWDGTTWTQQTPVQSPAERTGASMTAADGQLFLFGGSGPSLGASNGYGYLGDTWTWNGATWTELFEMAPRPRSGQVMATLGSTMMIFGGSVHNTGQPGIGVCSVDSDSCTLDDTYTWDGISSAGLDHAGPDDLAGGAIRGTRLRPRKRRGSRRILRRHMGVARNYLGAAGGFGATSPRGRRHGDTRALRGKPTSSGCEASLEPQHHRGTHRVYPPRN
jgi:hypothetical protein